MVKNYRNGTATRMIFTTAYVGHLLDFFETDTVD